MKQSSKPGNKPTNAAIQNPNNNKPQPEIRDNLDSREGKQGNYREKDNQDRNGKKKKS